MPDNPRGAAEWVAHLKAQLAGEAEPILPPVEHDDDSMNPPPERRDWQ